MMDRTFNYAARPPQSNLQESYVDDAAHAYRDAQMPRWLQSKQKALDLTNMLMQTRAQYAPQMFQEKLQGMGMANQAAANNLQFQPQMLAEKLRGLGLSNAAASENLGFLPAMMQAKLALMQAQTNRVNNPIQRAGGLSPVGKLIRERTNIANGLSPDGSQKIDPSMQVAYMNAYDRGLFKAGLTAKTINQLFAGNQLEVTLNSVDPSAMAVYSGTNGKAAMKADQLQSQINQQKGLPAPERWQKYQAQSLLLTEIAKQYQAAYGTSIQPSQVDRIDHLTNMSNWTNDPQTTANLFNEFASSIKAELNVKRQDAYDPMKLMESPGTNIYGQQVDTDYSSKVPDSYKNAINAPFTTSGTQLRTSFDSKQDFDSYKASLSPADRARLKQQMGIS